MGPSQVATRAIGADGNTLEPTWWCALSEGVFGHIVGLGLWLVTCRGRGWASSPWTG